MTSFIITLGITFCVILIFAFLLNYCRRKLGKTRHGLSGMCHKNGGPVCPSCSEISKNNVNHH